jgi:hypothetical protein
MAETVIRIYETEAQAGKAASALRDYGFANVFQFTAPRAAPAAPPKAAAPAKGAKAAKGAAVAKGPAVAAKSSPFDSAKLVAEMTDVHILRNHAESYAAELQMGGSLVKVSAPFGSGSAANEILDSYAPRSKGFETPAPGRDFVWDDAAPLSSVLQLPTLTNTEHPAETLTGIASLTKGTAFLSDLFGIPLLSRGSAQKTSSFGIPLLSRGSADKTSSFGLPLLSNSPTPLSSMLGLKVLK